jgi:hypothetical protein
MSKSGQLYYSEIEQRDELIQDLMDACKYTLGHILDNPKYQKDDALWSCVSHLVNVLHKAKES